MHRPLRILSEARSDLRAKTLPLPQLNGLTDLLSRDAASLFGLDSPAEDGRGETPEPAPAGALPPDGRLPGESLAGRRVPHVRLSPLKQAALGR